MLTRTAFAAFVAVVASHATQCSQCSKEESASGVASATGPARTASCDRVPAMSLCSEYSGAYLAQHEAVLSSGCAKLGGAFVAARCPNSAVLGSCELPTTEVRAFYASGAAPYDAARAEKECVASYRGKWSALR